MPSADQRNWGAAYYSRDILPYSVRASVIEATVLDEGVL